MWFAKQSDVFGRLNARKWDPRNITTAPRETPTRTCAVLTDTIGNKRPPCKLFGIYESLDACLTGITCIAVEYNDVLRVRS